MRTQILKAYKSNKVILRIQKRQSNHKQEKKLRLHIVTRGVDGFSIKRVPVWWIGERRTFGCGTIIDRIVIRRRMHYGAVDLTMTAINAGVAEV